ncbi:MAG: hypothetical protein JWN17_278 [Frankiales bacterium]|nr:hypothetical protein [Frankiales bacterium]
MRAPRLLAAGAATASLLTLSACQQPTPIVSVVSGGKTVHDEAVSYCFDGQDPSKAPGTSGACRYTKLAPQLVRVRPGEQVGVDVSKEVADGAWVLQVTSQAPSADGSPAQPQTSGIQDSHYFTFAPSFENGAPIELQVKSLASSAANAQVTGVWRFVLAPK